MKSILFILTIVFGLTDEGQGTPAPPQLVDVITYECEAVNDNTDNPIQSLVLENVVTETFGYGRNSIETESRLKTAPAVGRRLDSEGFQSVKVFSYGNKEAVTPTLYLDSLAYEVDILITDSATASAEVTATIDVHEIIMFRDPFKCTKTVEMR